MARIRTVKPEFFRHEGLFDAEREEGLPLRVAFAGLWTSADREGRFRWRPRELKLDCLPHDEVDFARVLDALLTRGFIVKYTVDGKEYGFIPSWHDHQIINNREKQTDLPEPNESNSLTRAPRVTDACATPLNFPQGEGKGREGERKGTEKGAIAPNGNYAFEGEIIKLNQKNLSQWEASFKNVDVRAELLARDAWLSSARASSEDKANWFVSTASFLAKKNREAKVSMARATDPPEHRQDPRL